MANYNKENYDDIIDISDSESESNLSFVPSSNQSSRSSSPVILAYTLPEYESTSFASRTGDLSSDKDHLEMTPGVTSEIELIQNDDNKRNANGNKKGVDNLIPERKIDVEIPNIFLDPEIDLPKSPKRLSSENRPYFVHEIYESEVDKNEILEDGQRGRAILRELNTIKWHRVTDKDVTIINNSKTRILKWSHGIMTLQVGSAVFDVSEQPLMIEEKSCEPTKVKKITEQRTDDNPSSSCLESEFEDSSDDENEISLYDIKNQFNKKTFHD